MPARITVKQRHKYKAHPCYLTADGEIWEACLVMRFDSKKEARRWLDLKEQERLGLISSLERQVVYIVGTVGNRPVKYVADFRYTEGGKVIVEDAKGKRTKAYMAKKRAMSELHGVTVRET